jgi:putative MATE family efflux protein
MFIEELTGGITSFADIFFISMISDEAAASVGTLGSVLMLGYFILPQFTAAGTSVASQYIGAKRLDRVVPSWLANILISTTMGTLLGLAFFVFSGKIGLWLGMTGVQNDFASQYLLVIAFNFIMVGIRYSYCSILASQTLTKWNMVASIVTNLVNIPLNWALMTGFWIFPELGIAGVALATVISYFIGFAIVFYMVHFRLKVRFFAKETLKHVKEVIVPILKIGIPSALEPFSYTMQSFVVSVLIIKLGTIAMAANTYINKFMFLDMASSWSLTMGGQILMSHYLGAGRVEDVRKTFWSIARIIAIAAFGIFFVLTVFNRFFVGFFTSDPEILATCFALLVIALVMEPIRSMNILGGIALKTVGDGKFSVIISLAFMWGLVPVIILSSRLGLGIVGLWACLLLDETLRAIINAWRWKSGKWMGKTVIAQSGQ